MRESGSTYTTRRPVALALGCVLIISASFIPVAAAPDHGHIVGSASVIDGDTIDIAGQRIRLEGIDAPESGQTCARRFFGTWRCGAAATKALRNLVEGRTVTCENHGTDRYGRMLGVCFVEGIEINRRMVTQGDAWAFVKYSTSYVAEEQEARARRRGIFATRDNQPPWEYRKRQWSTAQQHAPAGCAIKGNVTRNGRIYHMPWSPWYDRVTIEEARGERWFCSEKEAMTAGWRPAQGS